MTTDPERALVEAVLARLAGDGALTPWLGAPARVHAAPPKPATYPYVTVSRTQSRPSPWQGGGTEVLLTVTVVCRHGGAEEARGVTGAVRAALEREKPVLAGHRLVDLRAVYADVFAAADPRATLGVLRLRAVTEPLITLAEEAA
jgi:hypothetical protein